MPEAASGLHGVQTVPHERFNLLQVLILGVFVALVVMSWGVLAPQGVNAKPYAETHLTTLLLWGVWWVAMVWMAVMLGRVWCTVWPLESVSNCGERLARRLGLLQGPLHKWIVSRAIIVGLIPAIGFTGCAHYHPKPISAENTAADFSQRTLHDAGLKVFLETNLHREFGVWPLASWDFTNLTLAAFYYHPDLDVARAQWAVAKGGKITAAERPNPTLNVTPGYDTTTLTPSPWLPLTILDIPIETAGKRGYRIAHASQLSEVARLNIASVAWQVRTRVRSGLLVLYAAQETGGLLKDQGALQNENLRLLELQYAVGEISSFELTQGRIVAENTRLALRDAERQSAEARVRLAEAIGVAASALDSVQLSSDSLGQLLSEASLTEARRQAMLKRSDILGALAEYAASESALQWGIAKQYPDIHLTPGFQFDQGDNKWSLGLTLTLPVLNRNKGAIAEAQAKRTEAAARFNALQARVLAGIDLAVAGYRVARLKEADANALFANLQKQERTARAVFEAGEISKSELVGLRLQLSVSALARLDALVKSQEALGALEDMLQRPLGLSAAVWQTSPRISDTVKGSKEP